MIYAEVLLREMALYGADGEVLLLPDDVVWSSVEYRDPETCGCSIEGVLRAEGFVPHDGSKDAWARMWARQERLSEQLGVDGPGSTMCRDCRDSWECDHLVRGPIL